MPARRLAISYSRFSDPKQAKGDSEDRQDREYRAFCQRHNLTPGPQVFVDRGRSGYKDEHRRKGDLGHLIADAKDKRFDPGTVVVVEAWDRLGRLRPDKQTELIAELLRTGVDIGVCQLNDIFTEDDFGTHKWTTLAVFIQLAYQESKQKAERVAASWERRRQRARENGAPATNRLPAWIENVNGKLRLIPERAAVVRRIIHLAAEGLGVTRIAGVLDREGVPSFGEAVVKPGRRRSQFSGKWQKPYITLLLRDRRAIGEFQPHKIDDTPEGSPIAGSFPAVVSEEEFLLARAAQEQRRNYRVDTKGRRIVSREAKYVNVFKSLLRHARDGEGMLLHNKGTAEKPELILLNASGNMGRSRCYTFPYAFFEEAILGLLREVDPREVLPSEEVERDRADVLRASLKNVRADMARLQEDLREGYSKALAGLLREREAQEEKLAAELQDELARAVKPVARAWEEVPTLVDLIRRDGDVARLKIRPVLRRVIGEAWVLIVKRKSYQFCAVQVYFTGGAHRDYLLLYQPKAYRRPRRRWADSLASAAPGTIDLRDPGDVRKLESLLSAVNVTTLAAAMTELPPLCQDGEKS